MFFKSAQTFFRESLRTPLHKKSVTSRIYAYPASFVANQFFSSFFGKSILCLKHYRFQLSFFYTRALQVFGPIFDILVLNRLKFFSDTIWRLVVRENIYPTISPHIRHKKSKSILDIFSKNGIFVFFDHFIHKSLLKTQNPKNIENYEVFHKSSKCFNIQLGVEKYFCIFRFCF